MKFIYPPGATPLDVNEVTGLIPTHISLQSELNEWEQDNIIEAEIWLQKQNFSVETILGLDFLKNLHYRMFSKTWKWAGKFRQTNKNIGVEWHHVSASIKILLDDVAFQIKNETYSIDEIVARLHHRLVAVHPFPNGNGRHARCFADIILSALNVRKFTWGQKDLAHPSTVREEYISALRSADRSDYELLLNFVKK